MFIPVILAGGSGSRLWPLSRQSYPKQFLALNGPDTMLQQTLSRLQGLEHTAPLIVSNEQHRFIIAEQLRTAGISSRRIILEPLARNTAPAIALAALDAIRDGDDPLLLVLAADHHIANQATFHQAVQAAREQALAGRMVTFGICPTHAETGFGYIQCGDLLDPASPARQIRAFREKPDAEQAQHYLDSGEYLWNSGMFMFRASRYLQELERLRPDILQHSTAAFEAAEEDRAFLHIPAAEFSRCDDESIDYAVMEQTTHGAVVPLDAGWSDLGSWSAIWEAGPLDENHNHLSGDVLVANTRNSLVHSHHRLVATVGLDNVIVIETKDAVLVADKDQAQNVKDIVGQLKAESRTEYISHPLVNRPWGHYDTIDLGDRYQVKRICVQPGECLSLQLHYHRAEHWIVVSGTAKVICGDKELLLTENQSTYIPLGVKHSLSNPGKVPLELIEVQSGSYLGEDDIVRFQDRYGRVEK